MNQEIVPECIGIIMDGNRRWAKARGLPTFAGHREGYENLRRVSDWCREAGVANLIVYAFSTENWNRSQEEVGYLMNLFRDAIQGIVDDALQNETRVIFLGERKRLAPDILQAIRDAEEQTGSCKKFTIGIALSYGGRAEILDAIHRISADKIEAITEEEFSSMLWTKSIPDPDLVIRTSGEERISGFLPWQSVYSEFHFTKTLWPDLSKEEFFGILADYAKRNRRRGQ